MLRTLLYDEHVRLNAKLTEFAGWEMPLLYDGIRSEHRSVREAAGLFDLSHMGRIEITGEDRLALVDSLSTNRIANLAPGRARYTILCTESGGVIDDLIVFCEEERLWVVPNASNREAVLAWLEEHAAAFDVDLRDLTFETGMLAVQGPKASAVVAKAAAGSLDGLGTFQLRSERLFGGEVVLSRTGYTGEDGFEIIVEADRLSALWRGLLEAGGPSGLVPAGLGARDTLRLEAGLCLYGHELTREINPIEAGLGRFVKFKNRRFVGRDALVAASREGKCETPRLVGLELASRRIARHDQPILSEGKPVGRITSGTFSMTLEKSIAMGYVPMRLSATGTELTVSVSHAEVPSTVADMPFYLRSLSGAQSRRT